MNLVDNYNIAWLFYGLPCKENSNQPEDDPWKSRNMSLREAM